MTDSHLSIQELGDRGLLIFDGQCGFCRRWVRYMESWLRKHPKAVAWQSLTLSNFGVTEAQCSEAVQFVSRTGKVSSGSDAAAQVLRIAGFPFNIAGLVLLIPGIKWTAQRAYKWVANNRHRFKGDPIPS